MQNGGLDEAQARIKIAGRNINNVRYADDITLNAENKEGLKSLLMKMKEESEKAGLKLTIQKTKIMASGPITLWQSSSLSAIRVVSSAYLSLLIFLPAVLILACASSSPAFLMIYSAYKLNKQGYNIQP